MRHLYDNCISKTSHGFYTSTCQSSMTKMTLADTTKSMKMLYGISAFSFILHSTYQISVEIIKTEKMKNEKNPQELRCWRRMNGSRVLKAACHRLHGTHVSSTRCVYCIHLYIYCEWCCHSIGIY